MTKSICTEALAFGDMLSAMIFTIWDKLILSVRPFMYCASDIESFLKLLIAFCLGQKNSFRCMSNFFDMSNISSCLADGSDLSQLSSNYENRTSSWFSWLRTITFSACFTVELSRSLQSTIELAYIWPKALISMWTAIVESNCNDIQSNFMKTTWPSIEPINSQWNIKKLTYVKMTEIRPPWMWCINIPWAIVITRKRYWSSSYSFATLRALWQQKLIITK